MGVIKRQGIKNTISTYIGFAIGFLNLIVIQPQFLSKEELGLTRVLYSFALLVATFVPLGIGNTAIRYFPQFKDSEKRHHGFLGFMLLFPIIGFAISSIALLLFKDQIMQRYASESPLFNDFFNYVFPLTFVLALINVFTVYCIANYKSTIPSYVNDIVVRLLTIVVVSLYYIKWLDLNGFIVAFCGIYAIQLFSLVFYVFIFDKPGFIINRSVFHGAKVTEMVRYGIVLWFAGVSAIGLKYFDSIMIGQYMPLAFVGVYTVVSFISTLIEAPLNAFDRIASSKISFAWQENNMEEIRSIYSKSSLYMFLIGGFLFLNVNLNITDLLLFLPDGYQQGAPVVWILSTGSLFNMATGLNAAVLFTSNKYAYGAFFLILLAALLLLFQSLFIPLWGISGAALATAAASLIYNFLLFIYVKKQFGLQPFERGNLILLFSILLLMGIGYAIPSFGSPILNVAIKSSLISAVYLAVVYFSKIAPEAFDWIPLRKKKS